MTNIRIYAAFAAALLLTACGAQDDEEKGDAATPTPSPEEPVSILRPDVEQPEVEKTEALPRPPLKLAIGFPEGGATLDERAVAALEEALTSPQLTSGGPITLRGHSDAGGNDAANMRASQARAEAVRDWLIKRDVDESRFTIIAFGEQNPVKPNALPDGEPNEAGRATNRRVEMTIIPPTDDTLGGSESAEGSD